MQMNAFILATLIMAIVWASRRPTKTTRPPWAEQLQGWQMIFVFAAMLTAFLIVLNPEFVALGLLGDSAFFDLLVLALGLQFRSVAFLAWKSLRRIFSNVRSFAIRSLQRDYAVVVFSLAPIGAAVLTVWKVAVKFLRHHDHMIS